MGMCDHHAMTDIMTNSSQDGTICVEMLNFENVKMWKCATMAMAIDEV